MNKIVLGVFFAPHFDKIQGDNNLIMWPFGVLTEGNDFLNEAYLYSDNTAEYVVAVSYFAEEIHFILDNVRLPLTYDSVTCWELINLLEEPILVERITFWANEKIVNKRKVLDLIQKTKDETLTFNDVL
jgi:hypothetical protein